MIYTVIMLVYKRRLSLSPVEIDSAKWTFFASWLGECLVLLVNVWFYGWMFGYMDECLVLMGECLVIWV